MNFARRFFAKPRTTRFRAVVFQVHLYAGLAVGVLALAVGLSGSALVFRQEIEAPPRAAGCAGGATLEQARASVAEANPGYRLAGVRFQEGRAWVFHLQPSGKAAKHGRADRHAAVHPCDGKILETREGKTAPVFFWLERLHYDLLADKPGRKVNGAGALLLLLLCLSGLVLWWPGPGLWRQRLGVKTAAGWKRVNWDLHNAAGFWIAGVLAVQSLTGAAFAYPQFFKDGLRSLLGGSKPAEPRIGSAVRPAVDLDAIRLQALAAIPGAQLTQIKLHRENNKPITARLRLPGDWRDNGGNLVHFHPATGEVAAVELFRARGLGARLVEGLDHLHFGRVAASPWVKYPLKVVLFLAGLAPGLLYLTGFLMWRNRVLVKRIRAGNPAVANHHATPALHPSPAYSPDRLRRSETAGV